MMRSDAARISPEVAQRLIEKVEGGSSLPQNSPVLLESLSTAQGEEEADGNE